MSLPTALARRFANSPRDVVLCAGVWSLVIIGIVPATKTKRDKILAHVI